MGPKRNTNVKERVQPWPRPRQHPRERDQPFPLISEGQGRMNRQGNRDDGRSQYMEEEIYVTGMRDRHGYYEEEDNMGVRRRDYNPQPGGRAVRGRNAGESDFSTEGGIDSFPIHGGSSISEKREYDRFPHGGERSTISANRDFGRFENGRISSSKREYYQYPEDDKHTLAGKREQGRFPHPGQRKGVTARREYEIPGGDRSGMVMRRGCDGGSNDNRSADFERRESDRLLDEDRRSGLLGRRGDDGFYHGEKGDFSQREHHGRVYFGGGIEAEAGERRRECSRYGGDDYDGIREYTRRVDVEEGKWQSDSRPSHEEHMFSSGHQWEQMPLEQESRNMDSGRHGRSKINRDRSYTTNNYSDSNQYREFPERTFPSSTTSTFNPEMNIIKSSGVNNDLFSLPLGRFHKDEGLGFQKHGVVSENPYGREMSDRKDGHPFPLSDSSHHGIHCDKSSSQAQVIPQRGLSVAHDDGFSIPRGGFGRGVSISGDIIGQERAPKTKMFLEPQACNLMNFGLDDRSSADNPRMDREGSKLWHSESGIIEDGYYQNMRSVHDHGICDKRNPLMKGIGDKTILPGSSSDGHLGDGGNWERHDYNRMSGPVDARMVSFPVMCDREIIRNQHTSGEHDGRYHKYEDSRMERGFVCDREGHPYDHEQRLRSPPLREWGEEVHRFRGLPEHRIPLTEEFDQEILGGKAVDVNPIKQKFKAKLVGRGKTFDRLNMAGRRKESQMIEDGFRPSDKYGYTVSRHVDRGEISINRTPIQRVSKRNWVSSSSLSRLRLGRVGPPNKSSVTDIKKRLKATSYNLHVSKYTAGKRLSSKPIGKRLNIVGSESVVEGGSSSCSKATFVKTEPCEGSDEFRQLVQSSFLKFVKQIYENPDQIGKYKEGGGIGPLKCIVCGSNSEEFGETRRLAEHTWACGRGGKSRVRHSGFHRALCFVMGWRSGSGGCSNGEGGVWEMEQLSEEEAASEKEDLIIWPPFVLVHSFPNTPSPITPDLLKDHLREEGFGGEGGRYGKVVAAEEEEGAMVVCFSGTLSGFQEAERLERLLGEKRRIRGDYRYYGKLGVAADVQQVDVESRKRCVVKSKSDILAIAHHTPITSTQYSTL